MLRTLLLLLVLLLLPTFLYYSACVFLGKQRARDFQRLKSYPWIQLIAAGVGLCIVLLALLALGTGYDKDVVYIPSYMKDGKLVPAQILPGGEAR